MLVALTTVGCTLPDVPIDDARCPCVSGYRCDSARDRCVRVAGDAGRDAGGRDAGEPADAGERDSGPGLDSAMPILDAGLDNTACDDDFVGAVFCDGFENPDLLTSWPISIDRDGVSTRVSDPVYRGTGALRASTTLLGGRAGVRAPLEPAITTGDLWMRGYFFVPPGPELVIATILISYGEEGGIGAQVRETYGAWMGSAVGRVVSPSGTVVPRDRWLCFEVHITIAAEGMADVFVDGEQVITQHPVVTTQSTGWNTLTTGLEFTENTQEPLTIYVDEVAVGTTRLPCD